MKAKESMSDKLARAYTQGADAAKAQMAEEIASLKSEIKDWREIAHNNSDIIDRERNKYEALEMNHAELLRSTIENASKALRSA